MKSLSAILLAIGTLFLGDAVGHAQDTSLYGKVRGADHKPNPPTDWKADVYAVVAGSTGDPVHEESEQDMYVIQVPTNARVTIWFHSAGYIPKDLLPPLNTGTAPKKIVRPSPVFLTKLIGNALLGTPAGRRQILDKTVEFGRATGAIDLVMYDLGVIRAEIGNNPEAIGEIDRVTAAIKSDTKFQGQITPDRELMWFMLDKVIERNRGKPAQIDPKSLLNLIKKDDLAHGIRYDAIRALTKLDLDPEAKEEMRTYFRTQRDATSSLLIPATFALARIGTDADVLSIVADVNNSDSERAIAAITAISNAYLTLGITVVARVAENESVEPAVRIAAIQSLDTLAARQERIAVTSLTNILEGQTNPEQFRIQAAEALRDVELPVNERRRVEKVANQDPSINVRTAATGAGKVKPVSPTIRP